MNYNRNTAGFGTLRSLLSSLPCPSGHITADKREIKDFPKLPLATSFIRKTLGTISDLINNHHMIRGLKALALIGLILGLLSCKTTKKVSPETLIIKNLYTLPCYVFRMDTLKAIESIGRFSDSICYANKEIEDIFVGFIYNLEYRSFIPAKDTSFNCTIPCGIGNPGHGKVTYWRGVNIYSITADSLTVQNMGKIYSPTRLSINDFKSNYSSYLNIILQKNIGYDVDPIRINMDISNNPPKEAFCEIFNFAFWTYFNKCFQNISLDKNLNLEEVLNKSQSNPSLLIATVDRIYIYFSRESFGREYGIPVLTPKQNN